MWELHVRVSILMHVRKIQNYMSRSRKGGSISETEITPSELPLNYSYRRQLQVVGQGPVGMHPTTYSFHGSHDFGKDPCSGIVASWLEYARVNHASTCAHVKGHAHLDLVAIWPDQAQALAKDSIEL